MTAKSLSNLNVHDTSIEEGSQTIVPAFDKFFSTMMMHIFEKQEKEENNLMEWIIIDLISTLQIDFIVDKDFPLLKLSLPNNNKYIGNFWIDD